MTNETTNSPEKIQEGVETMFQALSTARKLMGLEVPHSPDLASAIARLGIDPLFIDFRFNQWEVSLNHEVRHAFSLGCRVSIEIRYGESGLGPYGVTSEVTWASGGGDVSVALFWAATTVWLDARNQRRRALTELRVARRLMRSIERQERTFVAWREEVGDVHAALAKYHTEHCRGPFPIALPKHWASTSNKPS